MLACLPRAAQYACSLLGHALQKRGASPELQRQIRQLEGHLSLGRKRKSRSALWPSSPHARPSRSPLPASAARGSRARLRFVLRVLPTERQRRSGRDGQV